jgi:uncharacterized SAM-binding protein YcdF (DUF218 family)
MNHFILRLFETLIYVFQPSVLLILSCLLCFFCRRTACKLLLGLSVGLFYLSANGWLTQKLVDPLLANVHSLDANTIAAHNEMIVLGGGVSQYNAANHPTIISDARVLMAYQIYRMAQQRQQHYRIILSGGANAQNGINEARMYQKLLLRLGVPKKDMTLETKSLNTYQNALFLKKNRLVQPHHKYLLVTSALHMKRAQKYFHQFGINTTAAPSDFPYPLSSGKIRASNLALYENAWHEYAGIWRLKMYNYLQLN